MLGLAVGIDYALFIVTRFRQELRGGRDVATAVGTAVGTAGSAVVTAGLTVVIALAGLVVAGIPFLTADGPRRGGTIVVAVLVALTLVPAVLGFLGRGRCRARPRAAAGGARRTARLLRRLGRARSPATAGSACSLAVAALGVIAIPVVLDADHAGAAGRPRHAPRPAAEQMLADGSARASTARCSCWSTGRRGRPGRDASASRHRRPARRRRGDRRPRRTPTAPPRCSPSSRSPAPDQRRPTEQLVHDLRDRLGRPRRRRACTSPAPPRSASTSPSSSTHALPIYLALVVGLALVLLVLVFRSLLVPLVGVLGFLLTIGAALGATVAVFQWGWLPTLVNLDGTGPLISLTPILVIGILFGLAMDYQVFLVSRMHEAHAHGADAARRDPHRLPAGGAGGGRGGGDHVLGVRRVRARRATRRSSRSRSRWPSASSSTPSSSG